MALTESFQMTREGIKNLFSDGTHGVIEGGCSSVLRLTLVKSYSQQQRKACKPAKQFDPGETVDN
jgi:hypothetical protein